MTPGVPSRDLVPVCRASLRCPTGWWQCIEIAGLIWRSIDHGSEGWAHVFGVTDLVLKNLDLVFEGRNAVVQVENGEGGANGDGDGKKEWEQLGHIGDAKGYIH